VGGSQEDVGRWQSWEGEKEGQGEMVVKTFLVKGKIKQAEL